MTWDTKYTGPLFCRQLKLWLNCAIVKGRNRNVMLRRDLNTLRRLMWKISIIFRDKNTHVLVLLLLCEIEIELLQRQSTRTMAFHVHSFSWIDSLAERIYNIVKYIRINNIFFYWKLLYCRFGNSGSGFFNGDNHKCVQSAMTLSFVNYR